MHEIGMIGMSLAFEAMLKRGVREVKASGMEGSEVLVMIKHAEEIVGPREERGQ